MFILFKINPRIYRIDLIVDIDIRNIGRDLDIRRGMAEHLRRLQGFEIVIVCDDSGSMGTLVDGTQRTRWDELCHIVKRIIAIGVIFDSNGVDIHFLNRESYNNVKDPATVNRAFENPPRGYTPLVPVLTRIFTSNLAQRGRDKKLLVFVATDGIPTDNYGNADLDAFKNVMQRTRQIDTTYVSFLLCTDELNCMRYMRKWDKQMRNIDVTDDFYTERARIRECQKNDAFPFSHGDYIVKALVGAIVPEIDNLNECSETEK